jgi:hypothetical protein
MVQLSETTAALGIVAQDRVRLRDEFQDVQLVH